MHESERRRCLRMPYGDMVHILSPAESRATCVDLHEQGMCFITGESIQPGTPVTVVMFDRSIAMEAICKYQLAHSVSMLLTGVEFLQLQPELVHVVLRRLKRHQGD